MRGAAFLSSGLDDAMVVDVGGTTTDIGCLRHGFPREANNVVEVGGVRTPSACPTCCPWPGRRLCAGLGYGGTIAGDWVGQRRYHLTEQALVFGGDVLTATDIAVAAGLIRHRRPPVAAWPLLPRQPGGEALHASTP